MLPSVLRRPADRRFAASLAAAAIACAAVPAYSQDSNDLVVPAGERFISSGVTRDYDRGFIGLDPDADPPATGGLGEYEVIGGADVRFTTPDAGTGTSLTVGRTGGGAGEVEVRDGTLTAAGRIRVDNGRLNATSTGGAASEIVLSSPNGDVALGAFAGGSGRMTLSGAGAVLRGTDSRGVTLRAGVNGDGRLTVSSGAEARTFGSVYGGAAGAQGQATVFSGGTLTESQNMIVGVAGQGIVNLSGGSTASVAGDLDIAAGFNAAAAENGGRGVGMVSVSDSTLNVGGNLLVGTRGIGQLVVSRDAAVTANGTTFVGVLSNDDGDAANGPEADAFGGLTVSGGTFAGADLFVGLQADGELSVSGGTVTVDNFYTAALAGSTGDFRVSSPSSSLTVAGTLLLGGGPGENGGPPAAGGTGVSRVSTGGTLTLSGDSTLFSGNTLIVEAVRRQGGVIVNNGAMTDAGGSLLLRAGTLAGTGAYLPDVTAGSTFDDPVVLSPGVETGDLASLGFGNLTLADGGEFAWDVADSAGTGTAGVDWDVLNAAGTLAVAATAGDPFAVVVRGLGGFAPVDGAEWVLATFADFAGAFDPAAILFDTSALGPDFDGDFTAALEGGALVARFAAPAAVPEPASWALAILAAAGGAGLRRRRSAA